MGLTHYWERVTQFPDTEFSESVEDCKKLFSVIDQKIAGSFGDGEPVITENEIVFNGANGSACEDFVISKIQLARQGRDRVFAYCKTEHLPYDICVQTVLVIFKHHMGDLIKVFSDGDDVDWEKARETCQEYLGYGKEFQLEESK